MPALTRRKLAAVVFGIALAAAFTLPFLRPTPPASRYTVADLGLLPGDTESHAYGINARGAVAGFSQSGVYPQRSKQRACIFQNGKITELGVLRGATGSAVVSINAKGEATGLVSLPTRQAFLYNGVGMRVLGTRPGFSGSIGHAINDRGEVAGILVNNGWRQEHAFLYSQGVMTDVGVLPGTYKSEARGINAAGQVVGVCEYRGFHVVPFLYETRRKTMTALPVPASCIRGRANAINDHGLVVGSISDSSDGTTGHAALWSGGHLTVLGVPGGYDQAEAEGLNNWGDIVGQCYREPSAFQAFLRSHAGDNNLWQRYVDRDASQGAFLYQDGRMQDLNTLIPADAGWRLEEAPCINDRGQIAGTGLHNGQERAFLLTPR